MFGRSLFALAIVLGATCARADAAPITLIHSGIGTGMLAGRSFGLPAPTSFRITATGDTDTLESCGGPCPALRHDTARIDIDGVGSFTFITPTWTFYNTALGGLVGFGRPWDFDLFDGPAFGGWDFQRSVGPVSGPATLLQWTAGFGDVVTDGGVLVFDGAPGTGTFQAIVDDVPEPASMTLALASLVAAWGGRRRRR